MAGAHADEADWARRRSSNQFCVARLDDPKALRQDCAAISDELREQYTAGFVAPDPSRPGYRSLRVDVPGRPELAVRVRKGVTVGGGHDLLQGLAFFGRASVTFLTGVPRPRHGIVGVNENGVAGHFVELLYQAIVIRVQVQPELTVQGGGSKVHCKHKIGIKQKRLVEHLSGSEHRRHALGVRRTGSVAVLGQTMQSEIDGRRARLQRFAGPTDLRAGYGLAHATSE